MFALKAASRLPATSSQLSLTRSTLVRHLATEPSADSVSVHEVQGRERQRSIRKVSEEGGAHSQLINLAVKHTAARANPLGGSTTKESRLEQARRQLQRKKAEQAQASGAPSPSPSAQRAGNNPRPFSPRRPQGSSTEESRQPARVNPATDALALLRGTAERRPFNPRFPNSPAVGARAPRTSPRRNGPNSSNSKPGNNNNNKNRNARRPNSKQGGAASGGFSAADTQPLVPPAGVSYPSINLAQLLKADLATKALQVRQVVGAAGLADSDNQQERELARKVLSGDYSQWTAVESTQGKGKTNKEGSAVEHARTLLTRNPSVGLEGREVILDKLKQVL
ncbi:uncharacterized protein JCM15063_006117 [Sporobolomyces koalae]|uniref:uncharacterized protein n=1 Tax=Sporobolomyces koalae TaxID=500713 RepID=UPI003180A0B9